MTTPGKKWTIPGLAGLLLVLALVYAFWPRPVHVDLAAVRAEPMLVTIVDEGETRVRDIYVVSSPLAGRMRRLEGHVGDRVIAGKTVVATIQPTEPVFHDVRTHSELEAAVRAAEAARDLAVAELARLTAARDYAAAEYKRAVTLAERGTISQSALDKAEMEARTDRKSVV